MTRFYFSLKAHERYLEHKLIRFVDPKAGNLVSELNLKLI